MAQNNALLAMIANPQLPKINTPFELAAGVESIKGAQLDNRIKQKSLEPQDLNDKEKIENAVSRIAYVAQNLKPFVGKEYDPNTDLQYQQTKKRIEAELGMKLENLPDKYDKDGVSNAYTQGVGTGSELSKRYQAISTTQGFARFDPETGSYALDEQGFIAPNASPELQGNITAAKEARKGVRVTDPSGSEYYAPQQEVNPSFIPKGNNYGNIRPQGASTGFQSFNSPEEGLAAIDQNLAAYGKKGINTLEDIISRWSPPNENDTPRLIADAAKRLQIHPSQPIDLANPAVRQAVGTAIMYQEQGPKGIFGGVVKSPSIAEQEQLKANVQVSKAANEITAKNKAQAGIDLPKVEADTKYSMDLLDALEKHPGLNTAVGASSLLGIANIPGTEAANFKTRLDQIGGRQFLEAFTSLKGGGQITEIEGQKATEAMARLSTKQSPAEFKKSVKELKGILRAGLSRAKQKAGVSNAEQPTTKDGRTTEDLLRLYGGE